MKGHQTTTKSLRKPEWNYRNVERKQALKQSERDPTYEQRRQRRLERQRELLAQAAANESRVPRRYMSRATSELPEHDSVIGGGGSSRFTPRSPRGHGGDWTAQNPAVATMGFSPRHQLEQRRSSPDVSPHRRQQHDVDPPSPRSRKGSIVTAATAAEHHRMSPPIPAIKHRQQDTDHSAAHTYRYNAESDEPVPTSGDFVPFTRTSEILDPVHAESPLPVSREPTAMVKARRAYQRELNPAKYGQTMDHRTNGVGQNSDRPTSRQGKALQHLLTLKQVLMDKQRDVASMTPVLRENVNGGMLVSPVSDY
jgi:hypothetical protein